MAASPAAAVSSAQSAQSAQKKASIKPFKGACLHMDAHRRSSRAQRELNADEAGVMCTAKPSVPENFEEATWSKLASAVSAIQQRQAVAHTYEELYEAVCDLVSFRAGHTVYSRLHSMLNEHASNIVADLSSQLRRTGSQLELLHSAASRWSDFCYQLKLIKLLFQYLDRAFVLQQQTSVSKQHAANTSSDSSALHPLWDLGVRVFGQHLRRASDVENAVVQGVIALSRKERAGEEGNMQLSQTLCSMLISLDAYSSVLEPPFVQEAYEWYEQEGDRLLQATDVPEYLVHCDERIAQEVQRCDTYLAQSTKSQLTRQVEQQLVSRHVDTILAKGFNALCEQHRVPDLARLYSLLGRVKAHDKLRHAFVEYVKSAGEAVVADASDPRAQSHDKNDSSSTYKIAKDVVPNLLQLKQRLEVILKESFRSDDRFSRALREAFEHVLNKRTSRPAELVAKYVDSRLRPGNTGLTEADLESELDQVLVLFRHIEGKDVFEAFYKKDLAKRLLMNKSASVDAEKSMISKIKAECGSQFTTKLEGMFKDVDLSKEISSSFKSNTSQSSLQGVDPSVTVLTAGFWPSYPQLHMNLPEEIKVCQDAFTDFYLSKHSGRRLQWQHVLGHCTLRARFNSGNKELVTSLLQACVLMKFNDADELTLEQLQDELHVDGKELRRNLHALACSGKAKVLKKEPENKEVSAGDTFKFNASFSEKLYRIKLNTMQLRETPEEQAQTNERVNQDRQHQIDAAAVRVMKTRKKLSHQLLVSEVLKQLRFSARSTDVKKRIESLIEREYLERDPHDHQSYRYLA